MKFVLFILSLSFFLQAHAAAPTEVRIGTEGAYFPFNYIDPKGDLKGFDVDIAKALCEDMKVQCKFLTQDWDGIIPGLMAKKYDAIVASMAATPERRKKVAFTERYYNTPVRFVAKKSANLVITPEGLKGKIVGTQRGTTHADYLEKKYKGVVQVKLYDTQENTNMDLAAGRIDAVLADSAVMYMWMKDQSGKFDFVGDRLDLGNEDIFGDGANIALRPEDKDLLTKFNKAIAHIQANGTYDKIRKTYFPFDIK